MMVPSGAVDSAGVIGALLPPSGLGVSIANEWKSGGNGTFPVLDPASGVILTEVANADLDDASAALDAAERAQRSYVQTSPRQRGDLLWSAYTALVQREREFATLITLEMGKPFAESVGEVRYSADFLRWYAEEAPRISGQSRVLPDGTSRMLTVPRPVGMTVLVTPWNFPLAMIARKVAPAIAAGCVSIVKPAAETPLTTLAFVDLLINAGLPPGVVNVLPTRSAGPLVHRLLSDPRSRKVSFTGSTEVGRKLLATAAETVMRSSMELGGNAPFIVFADADLDSALDAAMVAKFRNGGQACTAANRFFVHSDIAEEFNGELARRVGQLKLGPGLDPSTTLGPMIHDAATEETGALVSDAVARGSELVLGGSVPEDPGSFFEATMVTDVPDDAPIRTGEIFGPVVSVSTFEAEDEVVARANATEYGLVAYAFTQNAERQFRLAQQLEYGMVAINRGLVSNAAAPFGGLKQSGIGREGSSEGLDEYLDYVYVALNH